MANACQVQLHQEIYTLLNLLDSTYGGLVSSPST
jgi:hypothetical protein